MFPLLFQSLTDVAKKTRPRERRGARANRPVGAVGLDRLQDRILPSSPKWISQGPGPMNEDPRNYAGAVSTIVPQPANADILYAAAVNGGVWRTDDATSANPTWKPLTDRYSALATT